MKANRFLVPAVFLIILPLILITGCKYNVTEPLWDQPYKAPVAPKITQVIPAEAGGGVNKITINGENLIVNSDTTWVYFNNTPANVISISATSIVVYRPNVVSDSCTIKIIPHDAIQEAVYKPYKITSVVEDYGGFLQNVQLSVLAVDKNENIYVVETLSKSIHKVTPDGTNSVIGKSSYSPYDGKIGPDGNLYLTEKSRVIDEIDVSTGKTSRYTLLPSGFVAKYLDFGSNNFVYCGGARTDLIYFPFDLSAQPVKTGFYKDDDIQAIRFYNGYLYVATINSNNEPAKIWKDKVNSDGSLGSKEMVFDLNSIPDSAQVTGITFGSDGNMYISTFSDQYPVIILNPSTNSTDVLYKGIIPPYCAGIYWGPGNYLYSINGNTTTSETWKVYRIDMGKKGAPYY